MTKRRPLTEYEQDCAKRLKSLWLSKKDERGFTQDDMRNFAQWNTQSAVTQYLNGRVPLNYKAIIVFSKFLGIEPKEVDPKGHILLSEVEEVGLLDGIDWPFLSSCSDEIEGVLLEQRLMDMPLRAKIQLVLFLYDKHKNDRNLEEDEIISHARHSALAHKN